MGMSHPERTMKVMSTRTIFSLPFIQRSLGFICGFTLMTAMDNALG